MEKHINRDNNTWPLSWKNICYLLIAFIIGVIIAYVVFKVNSSSNKDIIETKIEILIDNRITNKQAQVSLDSILNSKLQHDIQLVQKENDGRFQVLTWSSVLVITLLLIFITVNFIVSGSQVREVVDNEIDKRMEDIRRKAEKLEIESKEILVQMENIAENAQKEFEKIKEYNNISSNFIDTQNPDIKP